MKKERPLQQEPIKSPERRPPHIKKQKPKNHTNNQKKQKSQKKPKTTRARNGKEDTSSKGLLSLQRRPGKKAAEAKK